MARRSYRGLVKFPGLGFLPKVPSSVKPVDVALGVALGLAGSVGIKKATDAISAGGTKLPAFVTAGGPIVGGAASAAILYYAQKKKNPARAAGHALGALLGGLAVYAYQMLQSSGMLAGLVKFPGLGGVYMQNPRLAAFNGPIFQNPNPMMPTAAHAKLARLQGLGDENEDGLFPAP